MNSWIPCGITNGSLLVMASRNTLESEDEPSHPGKT